MEASAQHHDLSIGIDNLKRERERQLRDHQREKEDMERNHQQNLKMIEEEHLRVMKNQEREADDAKEKLEKEIKKKEAEKDKLDEEFQEKKVEITRMKAEKSFLKDDTDNINHYHEMDIGKQKHEHEKEKEEAIEKVNVEWRNRCLGMERKFESIEKQLKDEITLLEIKIKDLQAKDWTDQMQRYVQ